MSSPPISEEAENPVPWRPGTDLSTRFRGYLPVVVDLETGGFDASQHAILEMAAVEVRFQDGTLVCADSWEQAVTPYPGSRIDPAALKVTCIDPEDPARADIDEADAFREMFRGEDGPALLQHRQALADASLRSGSSSPDSNISVTMSQPPISSPFT